MSEEIKKRGRPAKSNLPKEIRDNIVESNLPEHVLDAIEDAVSQKEEEDKPKKIVGRSPIDGSDVWM